MGVIRHQTPRETSTPKRFSSSAKKIQVGSLIAVSLEDWNGSYARPSYVMWISSCEHFGNSRHAQTLVEANIFGQVKIIDVRII
jgi:hypothetical protein